MDSRTTVGAAAGRVYESFEPLIEWTREPEADMLMLNLPGFKKEQLRVQVTKARTLRVSGERPVDGKTWSRFLKEFPISSNCDSIGITAKFEKGTLFVRHPKTIAPEKPPQNEQAPKPEKSTQEEAAQKPPQEMPPPPVEAAKPPEDKVAASTQPPKPRDEAQPPLIQAPAEASKPEQKSSEEQENKKVDSSSLKKEPDSGCPMDSKKNYDHFLLKGLNKPTKYCSLLLIILFLVGFGLHVFMSLRSSDHHDYDQ